MRILYLTPGCFDKGGISRYSRYQIAAWRALFGPESTTVLSFLGKTPGGFEDPIAVTWHGGSGPFRTKLEMIVRALAHGALQKPQLVHAAHVNMSGLAHAIARAIGARSIVNVYGLEVWSGMRVDARFGLKRADVMISDCHWTARYVEEHRLRTGTDTKVIWDCVDTRKFSPGQCSQAVLSRYGIPDPATGTNLLTLGRMSPDAGHKGYERLLEAFIDIASDIPSLRLVYAGAGGLIEELRRRAAAANLAERVFFTGPVHEDDLPEVYRSAHLFSLISDRGKGRGEGIPLTPLEAASCGVPILVGNQDGSQEAVVDGAGGRILDPFDLCQQSLAIREIIGDTARRLEMGARARRRIEQEFSFEGFVDKHRQLVGEVTEG